MRNSNKGKVRWMIILGAPNLSSPYWEGLAPHGDQLEDHWYEGALFYPKKEAEEYSRKYTIGKYLIRIEKYSDRKSAMRKTF